MLVITNMPVRINMELKCQDLDKQYSVLGNLKKQPLFASKK